MVRSGRRTDRGGGGGTGSDGGDETGGAGGGGVVTATCAAQLKRKMDKAKIVIALLYIEKIYPPWNPK